MKYILTLEAHYKKRGLFGKAADWISNRKDFTELIEGKKSLGDFNKIYSVDKNDLTKFEEQPDTEVLSKALDFFKSNPDKFLVSGLAFYSNANYSRFQLIKFSRLIQDILDVCDKRLDIISVKIESSYEHDDFRVSIVLREDGWEEGDGMPDDIYEDYVQMIKTGLKKKKEQYIKEYNILQSQNTTQKLKYRSIRLYNVSTGYQSQFDDKRGLITVIIDPRI